MKKQMAFMGIAALALLAGLAVFRPVESAGSLNVSLTTFATGLSSAVDLANAGDDRLFAVEQDGRIRIIQANGSVLGTPFLDITDRVLSSGSEQGLLGLAFHPDYSSNGYFYVYYTRDAAGAGDGDLVIARFSVTANPNVADPGSEQVLLVIDHPDAYSNHNGGNLDFGPDGYLYIGTGDGGSGGDPWDNAQSLDVLLGKMLRIDVDGTSPGSPDSCSLSGSGYTVPSDNPFADGAGGDCDEIWAYGLRNPWRFAFDRLNGDLFIGDVGQGSWEEVDHQPASSSGGENYGWRCYEGTHPYNTSGCGPISEYVFPIGEYSHTLGCSITGGEIYRGSLYPELYGHYLFTDYCSGRFWSLFPAGGGNWTQTQLSDLGGLFTSFGQNTAGEIFVTNGGTVYYVVEDTLNPTETPSPTATATGTATPTATASPTPSPTPTGPTPTPVGPGAPFALNLVEVASGFDAPDAIASSGDEQVYVAERAGTVYRFDPAVQAAPDLVLDITGQVDDSGYQEGLLGLAFDPDFNSNGYFYVNYTDNFSNTVVSRFTMTGTLPVGTGSEEIVLTLPQPYDDNNGGGLAFGPDGHLYIALGDGGGPGDPDQLAQNPDDLHGKVLRIDVDGGGQPPDCGIGSYTIPADNPFTGGAGCDEIWQLGFRNIWGLSFDSQTGDLWIADVGEQLREEINFQPAASPGGDNYGWSCYEGTELGPNYDPDTCTGPFVFPFYEYDHQEGRTAVGGYVYRGSVHPFMQGYYFFADFVFGKLWTLEPGTGAVYEHYALFGVWSALGQGSDGELYIAEYGSGKIYRIEGTDVRQAYMPLILKEP